MTLKRSTRDISKRPGKLTKGVLFYQDNCSCTLVCGCNGCCAWLWLCTGWSPSIFSWFGTIWLFLVLQHEKTLGWEAALDWWFFEDQDESFYTKLCNTDWRNVWTAGETMLNNKPHCVKFDHRIIVSLWTLWQFMYIHVGTSSSFQVHVYI